MEISAKATRAARRFVKLLMFSVLFGEMVRRRGGLQIGPRLRVRKCGGRNQIVIGVEPVHDTAFEAAFAIHHDGA